MDILYFNDGSNYRLRDKRLIRKWLREIARAEGDYRIEQVNYIFCSSERHRAMNIEFLGHDYFTDIITFDDSRLKEGWIAGDIFIDVETVADNARIYGTTARREMLRVVAHGVLHLCGQKDKTPRTERQMHAKEDRYLALLDRMMAEREQLTQSKL
ncbi:MAG: rRNA maturation RNase YbeY [Alistipes sp.]|nr:rRNA maturation RNase YbeY [Alistipes sp.]